MKKLIILLFLVGFNSQSLFAQTDKKAVVKVAPKVYYVTSFSTFYKKEGGITLSMTPLVLNKKYEVWLTGPVNALSILDRKGKAESCPGMDGIAINVVRGDSSINYEEKDPLMIYSIVNFAVDKKTKLKMYPMVELTRFSDIYELSLIEEYKKTMIDVIAKLSQ